MTDIDRILHMSAARGLPDPSPDGVPCCDGYAYLGYEHCMCWEPVYDDGQADPHIGVEPTTRRRMCSDCAFRPDSPELRDSDRAVCGYYDLLRIALNEDESFWCHDGLRKVVAMRHPNGLTVPVDQTDGVVAYEPPIIDGIPYQLDGQPGLRCAGLAAQRMRLRKAEAQTGQNTMRSHTGDGP